MLKPIVMNVPQAKSVWASQSQAVKGQAKTSSSSLPTADKENLDPSGRCSVSAISKRIKDPISSHQEQIMSHLASTSRENTFLEDPFQVVPDLSRRMKRILFNWLFEVQQKFALTNRTIFLTENLLIRHIVKSPIKKDTLQLTGMACLLIASKFEDIYPPEIEELSQLVGKKISRDEIVFQEEVVLFENNFDLVFVSALDVAESLTHLLKLQCPRLKEFRNLILDLMLMSPNIGQYQPFQLAAYALSQASLISSRLHLPGLSSYFSLDVKTQISAEIKQIIELVKVDQLTALKAKYPDTYSSLERWMRD